MNLEPIKEALSNSTPGPWIVSYKNILTKKRDSEGYHTIIAKLSVHQEHNSVILSNAPEWLASLVAEVERKDRQLEEAQKTIATAYGIACEDFESVNQMDLIRLTLGEFLQSVRGDQHE